jgi:Icc-related predicted phosphoesterase
MYVLCVISGRAAPGEAGAGGTMPSCFFVSDLQGSEQRYRTLFDAVGREVPEALFLGGDLLPTWARPRRSLEVVHRDFVNDFLAAEFSRLRGALGPAYPRVFLILGNDDSRFHEASILSAATQGIWEYAQERWLALGDYAVCGYGFVPPTPFLLKDWERYDVSRHVDPGCVSPEEGYRTVPVAPDMVRHATIRQDLETLAADRPLDRAILLFHAPPYGTSLDRAALDGRSVDHVALDVHIGSMAIERFIRRRQPLLTLHGHVHESARLTGAWSQTIGRTHCLSAAHDGPELAIVRFDPADPAAATRTLDYC